MAMPAINVVVPAHNAGATLGPVLDGLRAAGFAPTAITVVDDGSDDDTQNIARAHAVNLCIQDTAGGAANARNIGARNGTGALILFVDADVVVHADVKARLLAWTNQHPDEAAVFGSYDAAPADRRRVSRVRNLLHHHTHQRAPRSASTFWTGLGMVRRTAFETVGGFDPDQSFMEDIAFGHALKVTGHHIALDKDLQGTHLKHWSVLGFMRADLLHRAIPWTRLIRSKNAPQTLNADTRNKASVICAFLALLSPIIMALSLSTGLAMLSLAFVSFGLLNHSFLRLLHRLAGPSEVCVGLFVLVLHSWMAGLGYAYVVVLRR